jgi:hypothetical protein
MYAKVLRLNTGTRDDNGQYRINSDFLAPISWGTTGQ